MWFWRSVTASACAGSASLLQNLAQMPRSSALRAQQGLMQAQALFLWLLQLPIKEQPKMQSGYAGGQNCTCFGYYWESRTVKTGRILDSLISAKLQLAHSQAIAPAVTQLLEPNISYPSFCLCLATPGPSASSVSSTYKLYPKYNHLFQTPQRPPSPSHHLTWAIAMPF